MPPGYRVRTPINETTDSTHLVDEDRIPPALPGVMGDLPPGVAPLGPVFRPQEVALVTVGVLDQDILWGGKDTYGMIKTLCLVSSW